MRFNNVYAPMNRMLDIDRFVQRIMFLPTAKYAQVGKGHEDYDKVNVD